MKLSFIQIVFECVHVVNCGEAAENIVLNINNMSLKKITKLLHKYVQQSI